MTSKHINQPVLIEKATFMQTIAQRKATIHDLREIIILLLEDDLGKTREQLNDQIDQRYIDAFHNIISDPNQYLMVVLAGPDVVGTCHLTLMPSLTFIGSTRMQIEAVRVSSHYRGRKIGEWMMGAAMDYAKLNDVSIIQLTTNKQRPRAKQFYERLGFKSTHEGMKYYF